MTASTFSADAISATVTAVCNGTKRCAPPLFAKGMG